MHAAAARTTCPGRLYSPCCTPETESGIGLFLNLFFFFSLLASPLSSSMTHAPRHPSLDLGAHQARGCLRQLLTRNFEPCVLLCWDIPFGKLPDCLFRVGLLTALGLSSFIDFGLFAFLFLFFLFVLFLLPSGCDPLDNFGAALPERARPGAHQSRTPHPPPSVFIAGRDQSTADLEAYTLHMAWENWLPV